MQAEPWWNGNLERQAMTSVWRQGQVNEVAVFKFVATNSKVYTFMLNVNNKKLIVSTRILEPLVRTPDDVLPRIPVQMDRRPGPVVNVSMPGEENAEEQGDGTEGI